MKRLAGLALLVLLLISVYVFTRNSRAATAVVVPGAVPQHFTHDEAQDLIGACGAPSADIQKSADTVAPGAAERTLRYQRIEFQFLTDKQGDTGWTMTGAFPRRGNDMYSESEAAKIMPCIDKVQFSNEFFQKD